MPFDLRTPIGLLFSLYGALLALRGLLPGSSTARSLGLNVDLIWGAALLLFGLALLAAVKCLKRRPNPNE